MKTKLILTGLGITSILAALVGTGFLILYNFNFIHHDSNLPSAQTTSIANSIKKYPNATKWESKIYSDQMLNVPPGYRIFFDTNDSLEEVLTFYDSSFFAQGWKEDTSKQPPDTLSDYETVKSGKHVKGKVSIITFLNSQNCTINLLNFYQGVRDASYDSGKYTIEITCWKVKR